MHPVASTTTVVQLYTAVVATGTVSTGIGRRTLQLYTAVVATGTVSMHRVSDCVHGSTGTGRRTLQLYIVVVATGTVPILVAVPTS